MPTFDNPRRVVVTEGGSGALATIAAVVVIAAVVSAEAVLIAQVIQAILVTAITALAGSSAVAILVFRRTGVWVTWRPPVLTGRVVQVAAPRTAQALPAPQLSAIEAPIDARRSGAAGTPARDQVARGGVPR
jgi:hypothetical protein